MDLLSRQPPPPFVRHRSRIYVSHDDRSLPQTCFQLPYSCSATFHCSTFEKKSLKSKTHRGTNKGSRNWLGRVFRRRTEVAGSEGILMFTLSLLSRYIPPRFPEKLPPPPICPHTNSQRLAPRPERQTAAARCTWTFTLNTLRPRC